MVVWSRGAALLLACVLVSSCQRVPDQSHHGSPQQRLVGHWATSDGNEEYFGQADATGTGSFISVHAGGQPAQQRYKLLDENPRVQSVRIALLDDKGEAGEPLTITLAEDGESAPVAQDQATQALARMDAATTPAQSRYVVPASAAPAPARTAGYQPEQVQPPAKPRFGPPAGAPDGEYRYALVGYNGMTPLYAWQRVSSQPSRRINDNAAIYSRGLARRHDYVLWLHTVAFALLLVTTLLFRKDVGGRGVLAAWCVAIAVGVLGVFVLNASIVAGIIEIVIGFALATRGLFPKSDMLA